MKKNYEKELPQGYQEKRRVDFGNRKTGMIFNLIALLVAVVVAVPILLFLPKLDDNHVTVQLLILVLGATAYTMLHEVVHGFAYKALTKQKLTFGLKWSCAFCGVPDIYVYRKTAIMSLLAPCIAFNVLLLPAVIALGIIGSPFYLSAGIMFALHIGGCVGDLYVTGLLLFKYRDKDLLIRDTGPEQYIYEKIEGK